MRETTRLFRRTACWAAGIVLILCFCVSCTTAPMKVQKVHYFAVPGETNTNYFRLTVNAKTYLGDAEYRSGFFPASAVDSLFGDVSSEGGVKAMEAKAQLEKQIRDSLIAVNGAYQAKAQDPKTPVAELNGLLEARRRVLAYPTGTAGGLTNHIEIDYNPFKGLAIRHWDEKLVFILSSNPDEVVGKIANFAESDKTVSSINQLAKVTAQFSRNEIASLEAADDADRGLDSLIKKQIETALLKLGDSPAVADKDTALKEIDFLISLLDTARR
jgi:hypothetical protein